MRHCSDRSLLRLITVVLRNDTQSELALFAAQIMVQTRKKRVDCASASASSCFNTDALQDVFTFLGPSNFLLAAGVCRAWKRAYGAFVRSFATPRFYDLRQKQHVPRSMFHTRFSAVIASPSLLRFALAAGLSLTEAVVHRAAGLMLCTRPC
jgi:hypothetical protein